MPPVATARARAGGDPVTPLRRAAHAPGHLFDPPGGVPTLEDRVLATWESLGERGEAECLVCGGHLLSDGCTECGAELL